MGTNKDLAICTCLCVCVLSEPQALLRGARTFCYQAPIKVVVTSTMQSATMMAAILLLPMAMAGVDDTVDQLRNGFTIVPLSDQVESN